VVDNGFREVVLTGVNIGRYDYEGKRFENALEKILEIPGDFRVRISSIEPDGFSSDFPKLFDHPKLAPHLHLCLQSGSNEVLLRMRRMYTVNSFMEIISAFRKRYPDFNFTTDVIVGFPGETENDFGQTVSIVKEAAFSHIHTFRYSVRKGTRAERMPGQITEKLKAERSAQIRHISDENLRKYHLSMIGKKQRVLIEKTDSRNVSSGYGEHYIPVRIEKSTLRRNSFAEVVLSGIEDEKAERMTAAFPRQQNNMLPH
jgi:threonylcarbamoyladenosine tRNA methylthiotransferase MtaB